VNLVQVSLQWMSDVQGQPTCQCRLDFYDDFLIWNRSFSYELAQVFDNQNPITPMITLIEESEKRERLIWVVVIVKDIVEMVDYLKKNAVKKLRSWNDLNKLVEYDYFLT